MKYSLLIAALLVSGCATSVDGTKFSGKFEKPTQSTISSIGDSPEFADAKAKSYILSRLKDPDSAQFRTISAPYAAYTNSLWMLGAGGEITWIGWAVDVEYNAKNSFGGYVGFTCATVMFSHGNVRTIMPCFRPQPWDAPVFTRIQK